jgi:hypothetical protein
MVGGVVCFARCEMRCAILCLNISRQAHFSIPILQRYGPLPLKGRFLYASTVVVGFVDGNLV